MKSKNIKSKLCFFTFVILLSLSTTLTIAATDDVTTLAFPDITLTTTADVTIDTSASRYLAAIMADGFVPYGNLGIHEIYKDKLGKTHVILTTDVGLTGVETDNEVTCYAPIDKEGEVTSWQLEKFLNIGSYFIENTTDQKSGWTIATDFNSVSYQYALVLGMRSASSANASIIASYSDSLTGNIGWSNDTTNTTILNEFMATRANYWYRLDKETTNSSRPYVLHMNFADVICDAYYIFSLPADQALVDSRYAEIRMASSITSVNLTAPIYDWQGIMKIPEDLKKKWSDNLVNGVGWEDADDVKDTLYETWATFLDVTVSAIDSYNISDAWINTLLNAETSDYVYDTYRDEKAISSDLNTYVTEAKESSLRTVTITSEVTPKVLSESESAEDITDVTNAALASSVRSAGKSTSFSTKVLDWFVTSTGKVAKPIAVWMAKARTTLAERGITDNWLLILGGIGILGLGALSMWAILRKKK